MKKLILKILIICISVFFIIKIIYFLFMVSIFSHGAGGNEEAIEYYEFKMDSISFQKEWKQLLAKKIEIKDSIWRRKDSFDKFILFINLKKSNHFKVYYSHSIYKNNEPTTFIILVGINNKTNDQLGLFSWEKYKEVKLFEKSIIVPLSKKYKRIESN